MSDSDDRVSMELDADAWHQDEDGNHYIDCPECGSAATLSNVVNHGRCNAFVDEMEGETDLDETEFSCTASLSLELRYTSKPPGESEDETGDDPEEQEDVDIDDQASGTESAPSN